MPDTPDSISMEVGRLGGRLDAMEDRMARHERTTSETLTRMESKLDRIEDAIAQRVGSDRARSWVMKMLLAMLSAAVGILGALSDGWRH